MRTGKVTKGRYGNVGEVSVKTKQVIYYHDELTDEFSTAQIKARKIDENYCYDNNTLAGKAAHMVSHPCKTSCVGLSESGISS